MHGNRVLSNIAYVLVGLAVAAAALSLAILRASESPATWVALQGVNSASQGKWTRQAFGLAMRRVASAAHTVAPGSAAGFGPHVARVNYYLLPRSVWAGKPRKKIPPTRTESPFYLPCRPLSRPSQPTDSQEIRRSDT